MSEHNRDVLREHEFDGIREYDNPTPGWWHFIFLGSVGFGICYFIFYHMSTISWSVADLYQDAVTADLKMRFSEIGDLEADEATILRFLDDEQWTAVGSSVFKAQCVSCHAADGSGLVGPNLTDEHYKSVKKIEDIARVVADGAGSGAMPGWKTRLHPNEIVLVSAYVAGLRGRNLPGKRGAEGSQIPPWPAGPGPHN